MIHNVDLDEGLSLWRMSTYSKSFDKAWFPEASISVKQDHTDEYLRWWIKFNGDFLERNIDRLAPKRSAEPACINAAPVHVFEASGGTSLIPVSCIFLSLFFLC